MDNASFSVCVKASGEEYIVEGLWSRDGAATQELGWVGGTSSALAKRDWSWTDKPKRAKRFPSADAAEAWIATWRHLFG